MYKSVFIVLIITIVLGQQASAQPIENPYSASYPIGASPIGTISFKPKTARIKVERKSSLFASAVDYEVYVNGEKVGTISNNQTSTFDFELKPETSSYLDNSIYFRNKTADIQSNTVYFDLEPGNLVYAYANTEGSWLYKSEIKAVVPDQSLTFSLNSDLVTEDWKVLRNMSVPTGTSTTFTESISTYNEMKIESTTSFGFELGSGPIKGIRANLEAAISRTESKSFGESITVTRSTTISGNAGSVDLIWQRYWRTGTSTCLVNGNIVKGVKIKYTDSFGLVAR